MKLWTALRHSATATALPSPLVLALSNLPAGDKLVQLVYEALDGATAADTAHQEDLAAKRVLDKAHIKVGIRCMGWVGGWEGVCMC